MIYTLTLNPSLDYTIHVNDFAPGKINRTDAEEIFVGGKGINVSLVLKQLGYDSVVLGFVGGFTGNEIERFLQKEKIRTDLVLVEGNSRINIKMESNEETAINGMGPIISEENINALLEKIKQIHDGDVLIISGSVPSSLPKDIYQQILKVLSDTETDIVVDAEKELLLNTLNDHPFLIKPNDEELSEIVGRKIDTFSDALQGAGFLQENGARNVLVSMGSKGACLLEENGKEYIFEGLKGKVINTVGAGDSMVAGFIAGWLKKKDYAYALKIGSLAGSATAFSLGLCTKEKIEELKHGRDE